MDDQLALNPAQGYLVLSLMFSFMQMATKSIPGPGIGNYLTVAKAMASAKNLLGERS